MRCLNCHLQVGHYDPDASEVIDFGIVEVADAELYDVLNVALVVGGSIVIPHLRHAVETIDTLRAERSIK